MLGKYFLNIIKVCKSLKKLPIQKITATEKRSV